MGGLTLISTCFFEATSHPGKQTMGREDIYLPRNALRA